MRRGFKAWCERASGEYRQALGIPPDAPLDAYALAASLGVRVATPDEITGLSEASITQLTVTESQSWSAVTISHRAVKLVILNAGQSRRAPNQQLVPRARTHTPQPPLGRHSVVSRGFSVPCSIQLRAGGGGRLAGRVPASTFGRPASRILASALPRSAGESLRR